MSRSVAVIVRSLLGLTLAVAGLTKALAPAGFHADLLAYDLPVADFPLRFIAATFPFLEILCGAALLAGIWTETAAALVAGLAIIFLTVLGQAVWRGLDLRCGCFGGLDPEWLQRPPVALARAAWMLGAALWLWWRTGAGPEAGPPEPRG